MCQAHQQNSGWGIRKNFWCFKKEYLGRSYFNFSTADRYGTVWRNKMYVGFPGLAGVGVSSSPAQGLCRSGKMP